MDNNFFNDKHNLILLICAIFYLLGMLFNISWLESLSMVLAVLLFFILSSLIFYMHLEYIKALYYLYHLLPYVYLLYFYLSVLAQNLNLIK